MAENLSPVNPSVSNVDPPKYEVREGQPALHGHAVESGEPEEKRAEGDAEDGKTALSAHDLKSPVSPRESVLDGLRELSRLALHPDAEDSLLNKGFSAVKAAQEQLVVPLVRKMLAATKSNPGDIPQWYDAALDEIRLVLETCGLSLADKAAYGMFKDAIARCMDDDVLLPVSGGPHTMKDGVLVLRDGSEKHISTMPEQERKHFIDDVDRDTQQAAQAIGQQIWWWTDDRGAALARPVTTLLANLPRDTLVRLSEGETPFPPDLVEGEREKAVLLRAKSGVVDWLIEEKLKGQFSD